MYSYNDRQNKNNPIWDNTTRCVLVPLDGTDQTLTGPLPFGNPYYIIISNVGANNVYISPQAIGGPGFGILIPPGATFETAFGENAALHVFGTAGQTISIVMYG